MAGKNTLTNRDPLPKVWSDDRAEGASGVSGDNRGLDRKHLPPDLVEDGWWISGYFRPIRFAPDLTVIESNITVTLVRPDPNRGRVQGTGSGQDFESAARSAVARAR
jgi:hypothetical protein